MSGANTDYRDDLGEMEAIGERPLPDFLPSPDQLIRRDDMVEVMLAPSRASVEFFRDEAKAAGGVPYQRMIRALVDEHTGRHGRRTKGRPRVRRPNRRRLSIALIR